MQHSWPDLWVQSSQDRTQNLLNCNSELSEGGRFYQQWRLGSSPAIVLIKAYQNIKAVWGSFIREHTPWRWVASTPPGFSSKILLQHTPWPRLSLYRVTCSCGWSLESCVSKFSACFPKIENSDLPKFTEVARRVYSKQSDKKDQSVLQERLLKRDGAGIRL